MGKIAELQTDDKRIFLPNRTAHSWHRIITSNLRDGYISVPQCTGNDCGCALDSHSFAKPMSISLGTHSIHRKLIVLKAGSLYSQCILPPLHMLVSGRRKLAEWSCFLQAAIKLDKFSILHAFSPPAAGPAEPGRI
jgi:hypothetical protein